MNAYRAQDIKYRSNNNMGNCPAEDLLSNYLIGALDEAQHQEVERHLADCPYCIYRIAEAYEVLNESKIKLIKEFFMGARKNINLWLIGCVIMFLLSFLIQRYFIQFLVGAILLGIKWIVDNKNTKMLIMIYDAWKRGGQKEAGRIIESLDSRMKR